MGANRRGINFLQADIGKDLKAVQRISARGQDDSVNPDKVHHITIRIVGNIIRIQNRTKPMSTVAIDASVIDVFSKRAEAIGKNLVFFAYCGKHGYGKYVRTVKAIDRASGREVYKLVCQKCLQEGQKEGQIKEKTNKKRQSIFEKVFKIFKGD